mgnify:CR=1 FL=1
MYNVGMKPENSIRANWKDPEVFRRFIELCLIEARPNNYSRGSLKKECWEQIKPTLKAENKGDFTQRKLKNEWDYLKQKYIIWARLIGNTGNTHYDPVTTTINWTSKQWEEYLKVPKFIYQIYYLNNRHTFENNFFVHIVTG